MSNQRVMKTTSYLFPAERAPGQYAGDALLERAMECIRTLAVCVLLSLGLLIVISAPARAQEEPRAPTLRLHTVDATSVMPLARDSLDAPPVVNAVMLETSLDLSVAGLLAHGTLTQRFRNDSDEWREAEYLLPLPADAAVTQFVLEVDERRILGEIRERAQARQVFDRARRAGKRSALLEQQRPHLFTTRVANVPPGEEIVIRVDLLLPVAYRDGLFSLRFPTTLTPPYIPGLTLPVAEPGVDSKEGTPSVGTWMSLAGAGHVAGTDQVPDAALLTLLQREAAVDVRRARNPLRLTVDLRPGLALREIDALYHDLNIERRAGAGSDTYVLTLRDGVTEMDRDVVLRWQPRASARPQAAVFRESLQGEDYALLMVLPPQLEPSKAARLPREFLVLVDVSGSMQGESIRRARESLLYALDTLQPGDTLNIMAFSNAVLRLYDRPRAVTSATLAEARNFVRSLSADGGTEMLPALTAALEQPGALEGDPERRPLRQLLFVTDGAVGNEAALFDLLGRHRDTTRLFAVGIGNAPNTYLLQEAAALGRGQALYIADPKDVAAQLGDLFRRLEAPMASELTVDWPADAEVFPARVPDLYAGEPLLQVARLDAFEAVADKPAMIAVSGQLRDRVWTQQLAMPSQARDEGVATYWARQKIAQLMRGVRGDTRDAALRSAVLPLALQFSLASPFTSFVAVEEMPARPAAAPLRPVAMPNVMPKGMAPGRIHFAQGATTGLAQLYLGAFAVFIALLVWVMTRPEPDDVRDV